MTGYSPLQNYQNSTTIRNGIVVHFLHEPINLCGKEELYQSSTSALNAEACEGNRFATEEPPRVTARLAYPSSGNRAFEGS